MMQAQCAPLPVAPDAKCGRRIVALVSCCKAVVPALIGMLLIGCSVEDGKGTKQEYDLGMDAISLDQSVVQPDTDRADTKSQPDAHVEPKGAWNRTVGGEDYDYANAVIQTSKGTYLVAGDTFSKASGDTDTSDGWLFELDATGAVVWEKTYGGNKTDGFNSIQETADGGYIVAGSKSFLPFGLPFPTQRPWVVKVDGNGNKIWEREYGGGYGKGNSIQVCKDGGFVIAGQTANIAWISKLDDTGNVVWEKSISGGELPFGRLFTSVALTKDNGFIVTGWTWASGYFGYVAKLDSTGNIEWAKDLGSTNHEITPRSVVQAADGGYVLTGKLFQELEGEVDFWVIKLDNNGNTVWDKTLGGSETDEGRSIAATNDGGFVVAGYKTQTLGVGGTDLWLIKIDKDGKSVWDRSYGGGREDMATHLTVTSDNGFVMVGNIRYKPDSGSTDAWVLKLDSTGGAGPGTCNDGKCDNANITCKFTSCSETQFSYTCATPGYSNIKNFGGPGPGGLDSIKYEYSNDHFVWCVYLTSYSGYCHDDLTFECYW